VKVLPSQCCWTAATASRSETQQCHLPARHLLLSLCYAVRSLQPLTSYEVRSVWADMLSALQVLQETDIIAEGRIKPRAAPASAAPANKEGDEQDAQPEAPADTVPPPEAADAPAAEQPAQQALSGPAAGPPY
jgi:hypothetical protein